VCIKITNRAWEQVRDAFQEHERIRAQGGLSFNGIYPMPAPAPEPVINWGEIIEAARIEIYDLRKIGDFATAEVRQRELEAIKVRARENGYAV
jgi:hypothetical protein